MILYISSGTSQSIYDDLFYNGCFYGSSPAQKFNGLLIKGLAKHTGVISLSALPYRDINAPRIEELSDGVRYICIENRKGKARRINNLSSLLCEGRRIIKKTDITNIVCDAFSVSPAIAAYILGKQLHIPVTAIVTDVPARLRQDKAGGICVGCYFIRRFDSYVLLTRQMNEIVNIKNKPHIVMEGVCEDEAPIVRGRDVNAKKIILYTGALWKNNAGIEYFTKGFLMSGLEDYELHFYGQGEAVDWIKEITIHHPNVKYMGVATSEVITDKQLEASLLINPRPSCDDFTKYSFPSKTMEYMLSGTPVLMTRLPGVPEEYYEYVYTIEKETEEGVSDSLRRVLSDKNFPAKGRKAQRFVLENKCARVQSKRIFDLTASFVR